MSKLKLTAFVFLSVLIYPTLSYLKSPIDCARIQDNTNRLSCYDQIFSEFAYHENAGNTDEPSEKYDPAPSNWEITSTYIKPGPGVYVQKPTLIHSATTPSTNKFIRHPDRLTQATLSLLCQPEGTGLFLPRFRHARHTSVQSFRQQRGDRHHRPQGYSPVFKLASKGDNAWVVSHPSHRQTGECHIRRFRNRICGQAVRRCLQVVKSQRDVFRLSKAQEIA